MSKELELLAEIRDLLQIIAEPALAQRDAKLRASLKSVVGVSSKKIGAVLLMDGARSQSEIAKATGIDAGDLSRLVKELTAQKLIVVDAKRPKLLLNIPPNFFEKNKNE